MTMLAPPLKTLLGTNMDWTHNITKTRSSSILFLLFYTPIPNTGKKKGGLLKEINQVWTKKKLKFLV